MQSFKNISFFLDATYKKEYKNMMFNIGRLFHINKKNQICCTSITWVDIEFISEKKPQTVAVQRAAQTSSCSRKP